MNGKENWNIQQNCRLRRYIYSFLFLIPLFWLTHIIRKFRATILVRKQYPFRKMWQNPDIHNILHKNSGKLHAPSTKQGVLTCWTIALSSYSVIIRRNGNPIPAQKKMADGTCRTLAQPRERDLAFCSVSKPVCPDGFSQKFELALKLILNLKNCS